MKKLSTPLNLFNTDKFKLNKLLKGFFKYCKTMAHMIKKDWQEYSSFSSKLLRLFFLLIGFITILYSFSGQLEKSSLKKDIITQQKAEVVSDITIVQSANFQKIIIHNQLQDTTLSQPLETSLCVNLQYQDSLSKTHLEAIDNSFSLLLKELDLKKQEADKLITNFILFKAEIKHYDNNLLLLEKSTQNLFSSINNYTEHIERNNFTSRIARIIKLLFACFAGLTFLIVEKNSNKLIATNKVKLYSDKKIDKANKYMAWAVALWVIGDLFWFLSKDYYPFSEQFSSSVHAILSTLNSLCFLLVMLQVDFKNTPLWKNKGFYQQYLSNRLGIRNILILFLSLELVLIFTLTQDTKRYQEIVALPDLVLSGIVIFFLLSHLTAVFKERGRKDYNVLVFIIISFVLFIQISPYLNWIIEHLNLFNGNVFFRDATIIFNTLYQILLVSLFLFLADSWSDYFRGEKLEEERNIEVQKNEELDHRINNFLGIVTKNISNYIEKDKRVNDTQNGNHTQEILKEIQGNASALKRAHESIEKQDSLYSLFSELKKAYSIIFSSGLIEMSIDANLTNFKVSKKIEVENIAKILNEFVTNASKHNKYEKYISILIKIVNNNSALLMQIKDKNTFFDIEAAKIKTKTKRYSGLIATNKMIEKRGGTLLNFGDKGNGNKITIIYPINLTKEQTL